MHTTYLEEALGLKERKETVKKLCECIKKSGLTFDSIAFTGMSGALIAPLVAVKLKKNLVMVRKKSDKAHSNMSVEAEKLGKDYIIIDDLIFSGKTIVNLIKTIDNDETFNNMCPIAVFTYSCLEACHSNYHSVRSEIELKTGYTLRYQNCNSKEFYI